MQDVPGQCSCTFLVTPTALYMQDHESSIPIYLSLVMATIFGVMVLFFFIYDMHVQRRNTKMVDTAARTGALVSSIFPLSSVRERLLHLRDPANVHGDGDPKQDSTNDNAQGNESGAGLSLQPTKTHLKTYLAKASDNPYNDSELILASKPIADLFTETTIMFADICGFTAWSSVREPSQVFTLLETVYQAFDV